MRKLPQTVVRGRPLSAAQHFRGWLATWLQDRRRSRQNVAPPPAAPAAPANLLAVDTGNFSVRVTWTTNTVPLVTNVRVERKLGGEQDVSYVEIANIDPAANLFFDFSAEFGTYPFGYDYRARSFGPGGFSPYSNVSNVLI